MTWVMAKPWGNGTIVRKRVGGKPSFLPALHHFKHQFMNAPPTLFGTINSYNTGVHFLCEIYIFHLACKRGIFCEGKQWAVCIVRWKWIRFDQGCKMFSTRWMEGFSSCPPLRVTGLLLQVKPHLSVQRRISSTKHGVWLFFQQYSQLRGTLGINTVLILAMVFFWIFLWQCKGWHTSWGIEPH